MQMMRVLPKQSFFIPFIRGLTCEQEVEPLFKEGGVTIRRVDTERAGHATQLVSTHDLSSISAIVTVSGDGLLVEVFASTPCLQALRARLSVCRRYIQPHVFSVENFPS